MRIQKARCTVPLILALWVGLAACGPGAFAGELGPAAPLEIESRPHSTQSNR